MARPITVPGSRFPYARKVVPADVRHIIGRTEFKRPLRGATEAERHRQHGEALAEWTGEIEAARATLRGEFVHLAHRRILALCGEWYRAELAEWEDDPGDAEAWAESRDALDDGAPGPVMLAEAAAYLRSRGIAADADTTERFAVAWKDARARLYDTLRQRAEGDYSADRHVARFPLPAVAEGATPAQSGAAPLPAADLLDAWARERSPSPNTVKKYRIAFAHVARVVGFDDVRRITAEDVVRFKAARLDEGRKPQTVADDILSCGAVSKWGVTNRMLTANPFAGLAPRPGREGEPSRVPYSDAEAAAILSAARGETGWRRWLPWVLAFTGARIAEVAEMQRRNVREEAGVPIFDVVPLTNRAGKNAIFQRMIPVHPALVAEGFMDYVAALPADPAGPLFPDLALAKDGTRATSAKNAHGRWVRDVAGVKRDGIAPAHSWRHRMEDELRRVRALPEVVDAITGRHNPRNAGAGYGQGFRRMPEETLKELARVPLPAALRTPT